MRPGASRSSVSSRMLKVVVAMATASGALFTVPPTAPVQAAPVLGGQLFSTGEAVSVEVLPASAGLTSTLFLLEPEEVQIATNRDVGTIVTVGPYGVGEELVFGIRVSGQEYRMGPASRNPDGIEHATVDFGEDGCALVGFEDLFGGGDRDYDDNRFRFCGGIAEEPPDPEEPPAPPFVRPNADAGDDQAVPEGSVVTLDATRSTASNLVTRTWTTSADFGEGTSISLADVPPDQLQLDETTEAFAFIWVAASARGTVIKIDTATGDVLGEYRSAPQNRAKDPSRTTVDVNGNVWVGNRAENSILGGVRKGSVTHFGLEENGQCVDRNGNGVIDTSTGLGNVLPWPNASGVDNDGGVETAADECVLHYVRTNGVAIRQVSVDADNHVWVGGAAQGGSPSFFDRLAPDGSIVRSINMRAPADTGESGAIGCCYGGLIDAAGVLWSSSGQNHLVRIDPTHPNGHADLMRVTQLGRTSYGLGIDPDGFLWQSNWTSNTVQRISPAGAILGTFSSGGPSRDRGVAATDDGDIWVANSGGSSVSRLRNNGTFVTQITVGREPTGVAVDAAGKVWATNLQANTASRIDPATNVVDLTVNLGAGAGPYNYSDMTGATLTGAPDTGTWSVVYDSEDADAAWAFVDWAAQVDGDAGLDVTVASSTDGVTFTPDVTVADGAPIADLGDGRYLRVTVRFTRSSAGVSPVLFDLTVAREGDLANTLAYAWRLVGIDGPPVFLSSATSPTPSFVAPDDAAYTFELTVTDSAGQTDTDEVTVTVANLDPAVSAEIGSAVARGVTLVNASFTDPGWLDTHAATLSWGDGTPAEAVAVTAQGTGWGTFFGSHVYADAGSYVVSVTLTDDDGGSATVDLGQVSVAEPVAIWADSTIEKKTFEWTGGGGSITGRVHSNNEVKVAGSTPKLIDGPTEYVSIIQVDGPHTLTPVQSTVQPIPITYDLADYAPGGAVAIAVGAAYFDHTAQCVGGMWDVGSAILPVGVHYAPCSVKLNGSSIAGRFTLAASGSIELSGSRPAFEPYFDGLLLLSGATGKKAINVSASSSKFLGVIYAASGEVSLAGSDGRFFCAIIGSRVLAAGSNLTVRGANCGRPDSTVSGPLLVPGLELSLAAEPETTLPGGDIGYDLAVSNTGSLLVVPGLIGLENVDTAAATVTGVSYALEYFSLADGAWVPIASLADGRLALTSHANPAAGVTYPAPDAIVGTSVGPSGFATWGYQALVELTPDEIGLLLDPARVGGFRNRVEFTLDPATVQVRRLFTFGDDFIDALRALSGDITEPTLTFVPPAGDLVTHDGVTDPALAVLVPGETVTLAASYAVPVPAPRAPTETDAGYLSRLLNLDGAPLVGASFALASGGVGRLVAPLVTATTTEELPVVSISTLGPDAIPAGASADYELRLANLGSAAAGDLDVEATAADDALTVTGAPASLAAGELASAATSYSAPEEDPPADVTVAGAVTWTDANGNAYGPVGSARTTQILTPATLSSTLVDTLAIDVGGDGIVSPGDTVRYALTITNHGGQAVENASASVAPDVNSALVAGSVVTPEGTVVSGNGAGDASVEVAFATISGGTSVSLTYDVTVDDPFPAGVPRLETQGTVSADGLDDILTDDPARPGLADTTRTTVVVPVPNLTGFLSGRLLLDPDGNGFPSAGDTLRYELRLDSVGSLPATGIGVSVPTPEIAELVAASVTTSQGTVNAGSAVSVDVGALDPFTGATIGFDLRLNSPLPSGTSFVSVQGTVSSAELDDLPTDDPNTFTVGDPTVIAVGTAGGGGGGVPGVPGPEIGEISPAEGTTITEPTDIGATLTPPAGETVTEWTVSYRLEGDSGSTEIASGSGTTVAATLDPTVMPNGSYVVEIRATGSAGGVSVAETEVIVEGNLKLGRFQVTYQDLNVPVGGIPLQVLRTYDSFDKSVGDFGVGWQLEVANFRVATNGPLGAGGWRMFGCGGGFIFVPLCFESDRPHYVTVTWPDGRVETFDLTPARGSTFLSGLTSAQFTARPRSTSTLEALDSGLYFSNGDLLGGFFGSDGIYDPTRFRLTDRFGTQYLLEIGRGLISATDRNGNTVTVTDSGIVSSLGPSITFDRDGQDRITSVTAPDGGELTYSYDTAGDLVTVTDASGRTITHTYVAGHYLSGVAGAGAGPFQTLSYDDAGRLVAVTDANGHTTGISTDPAAQTEVVTSPDGRLTTITTFDERGNITTVEDVADGTTQLETFEYDELDRLVARTNALGHRTTATYDADGNLTSYTLPSPGTAAIVLASNHEITTTITYDAFGLPTSATDANGATTTYAYDAVGNLIRVTDPLGHSQEWTYDGDGNPVTKTDQTGNTWTFTYDSDGRVTSRHDPLGRATTFTYDRAGRLLTETDPAGGATTYAYDAIGNLVSQTDPIGRTDTYTYDDRDLLDTWTDAGGGVTTYAYDGLDNLTARTNPAGEATTYTYDAQNRVVTDTDPTGATTGRSYDGFGRLISISDALDRVTSFTYDAADRQLSITRPNGGTSSFAYDALGRRIASSAPDGGRTTFAFDAVSRLLAHTDPLDRTTAYEYDALGRLTKTTDPLGRVTSTEYDAAGRVVRVADPAGAATEYEYDIAGQLVTVRDPLDRITSYGYDPAGRTAEITDPLGQVTSRTYDLAGQLTSGESAAGIVTRYGYEPRGLLTTVTGGLDHVTTTEYDAAGRRITLTDPNGRVTTWEYDDAGRETAVEDALGGRVEFAYDAAGQLTSVTDPRGEARGYTYDPLGNLATSTDPLGRVSARSYDPSGRLVALTDARGTTVEHTYDLAGQLIETLTPDGALGFSYDLAGQRVSAADATGITTWSYDLAGRVVEAAAPGGSIGYSYDPAGQRLQMMLPDGPVDYAYDDAGRVSSVTDWMGATTSFAYDEDGRQTLVQRPNGVDTDYAYDGAGRLTGLTHRGPDDATLDAFAYTLDDSGNRTSVTSSAGIEGYTLDELERLTRVEYVNGDVVTYTYDEAGNITSRAINGVATTYVYDAAGQLASATGPDGVVNYSHDAAGNLVGAGADTFAYDWANQMVAATVDGTSHTYAYDADGIRVDVNGEAQLWDRVASLPELVAAGSASYLHSPDGVGVLAQRDGAQASYPLSDALGSTRALTDAAGAVVGSASYDAFGEIRSTTGMSNAFGFSGELRDRTELIHLRARAYDPVTARFTSADSVQPNGFATQGWNLYAYVTNNPTTFRDPSGNSISYGAALRTAAVAVVGAAALGLALNWYYQQVACVLGDVCPPPISIDWPDEWTWPDQPSAPTDRGGKSDGNQGGGGGRGGGGGASGVPIPWQIGNLSAAIQAALAAAGITATELALRDNLPIYRVWGPPGREDGQYWTPIDPRLIEALGPGTFRELAGLPDGNPGTMLATGFVDLVTFTSRLAVAQIAAPLDGHVGGLPEIFFFNQADVKLNVRGLTSQPVEPPF